MATACRTLMIFPHQVCVPESTYKALFKPIVPNPQAFRLTYAHTDDPTITVQHHEGLGTAPFEPDTLWLLRLPNSHCRIVTFDDVPKGSKIASLTVYLMLQLEDKCDGVISRNMNERSVIDDVERMLSGRVSLYVLPSQPKATIFSGECMDPFSGLPTPVFTEKAKMNIAKFVGSRRPAILKLTLSDFGDKLDAERYSWSPPNKLAETMGQGRTPRFYLLRGPDNAALVALTTWEMRAGRCRDTFVTYLRYIGVLRALHGACAGGLRIAQTRRYRDQINMEDLQQVCATVLAGGPSGGSLALYTPSEAEPTTDTDQEREQMIEQCAIADFQPVSRPMISSWVLEQEV